MRLIFEVKQGSILRVSIKNGSRIVIAEDLTISQGLDKLLISTIDSILLKSRIDRLSLDSVEILGTLSNTSVSGMVLNTIKIGLEI